MFPIKLNDVNICIRNATKFSAITDNDLKLQKKITYSYRIMIVISGNILITIGDKNYNCGVGSLIFLVPNQTYTTASVNNECFTVLNIAFDLANDKKHVDGKHRELVLLDKELVNENYIATKYIIEDAPVLNNSFVADNFNDTGELIKKIPFLHVSQSPTDKLKLKSLLYKLLERVITWKNSSVQTNKSPLCRRIAKYIDENFEEKLSCQMISDTFSYHPSYIRRIFKETFGVSLHDYIMNVKLSHAKELLSEKNLSVTEIAYRLSFSSPAHFSREYKKRFGCPPSRTLYSYI